VNSRNAEAVKKHISDGGEESKKIKDVFSRAVQLDHAEIVDLLLASGTDLKAKLDGLLHQVKSVEVANLLIENGANVNANSQFGGTPLDLLYSSDMPGNPAAEAAAPSGPLAELLRKHGGKTEMEIGNE
jgi:ankyrin repeat protein